MKSIQYLFPHWTDGMKISAEHFNQLESAILDRLRDCASIYLPRDAYGLLPPVKGYDRSVNIQVSVLDDKSLKIELLYLRAITQGGHRIEIDRQTADAQSDWQQLTLHYRLPEGRKEGQYFIVIGVDPFERVPTGELDPQESPPRHPFTMPGYQLKVLSEEELNGSNTLYQHLPIGKFKLIEGAPRPVQYIAPCTQLDSHPRLLGFYDEAVEFALTLRESGLKVIQKIALQSQKGLISQMVQGMTDKMLFQLVGRLASLEQQLRWESPSHLFVYLSDLAYVIKTFYSSLIKEQKEQLLAYFERWTEYEAGDFENILDQLIANKYRHHDLSTHIRLGKKFMRMYDIIYRKLLELEYIGSEFTGFHIDAQKKTEELKTGQDDQFSFIIE